MYAHVNPKNMQPSPLVADDVYQIIMDVSEQSLFNPGPQTSSVRLKAAHAFQSTQVEQLNVTDVDVVVCCINSAFNLQGVICSL